MTNNAVDPVIRDSFEESVQQVQRAKSGTFRKNNHVYLKKALAVAVVISLILLIALIVQTLKKKPKRKEYCATKECTLSASALIKTLDTTKNPCKNFYSFVCGQYVQDKSTKLDPFQDLTTQLYENLKELIQDADKSNIEIFDKTKKFYDSCTNFKTTSENGKEELLQGLEHIGGWPLANEDAVESSAIHLEELLAHLDKIGFGPTKIFAVDTMTDYTHRNLTRIVLAQYDAIEQSTRRKSRLEKEPEKISIMIEIAEILGNNDTESVKEEITLVTNFEQDLKLIQLPLKERSNYTHRNNPLTIVELRNLASDNQEFNWRLYFETLFEDVGKITLTDQEIIIVEDVKFFTQLPQILAKHSKRTIANYAIWNSFLEKLLENVFAKNSRPRVCIYDIVKTLPFVAGKLFINKYSFNSLLKSSQEFIQLLRDSYKDMISNSDWLDSQTKNNAIRKLNSMTQNVGYPDWIKDDKAVGDYYKDVQIGDDYLSNLISLYKSHTARALSRLREVPSRSRWNDAQSIIEVNAFYDASANAIIFPLGIIQPPFYENNRIAAMNFGGVGSIIGHEIGHGFDDVGSQFNHDGQLESWWSAESREEYQKRMKCFINQYDNFCLHDSKPPHKNDTCLDGTLTLGENAPDNTGLIASFNAYKRWMETHGRDKFLPGLGEYTPEQIFFISYAYIWCDKKLTEYEFKNLDSHSPKKYRVRGALSNFEEFSKAFRCPVGVMNRFDERCNLW